MYRSSGENQWLIGIDDMQAYVKQTVSGTLVGCYFCACLVGEGFYSWLIFLVFFVKRTLHCVPNLSVLK